MFIDMLAFLAMCVVVNEVAKGLHEKPPTLIEGMVMCALYIIINDLTGRVLSRGLTFPLRIIWDLVT